MVRSIPYSRNQLFNPQPLIRTFTCPYNDSRHVVASNFHMTKMVVGYELHYKNRLKKCCPLKRNWFGQVL